MTEKPEMMRKMNLCLLRNESDRDHLLWLKAHEDYRDDCDLTVVDLTRSDWLTRVRAGRFDGFLASPPSKTASFKLLYDERIRIIDSMGLAPVYPSPTEISIYENKRFLSYWLQANDIPHPATTVFYFEDEAVAYADSVDLPIVAKTSIGASGSGVTVLRSRAEVEDYTRAVFSGRGARRRVGPNLRAPRLLKRLTRAVARPTVLLERLKVYREVGSDIQTDFVLFQEFIPHDFEWRVVRIGHSFFAHKKLVRGGKASGSLRKLYDDPPLSVLDFVRRVTDQHHLYSQAVDLFESPDQRLLVNEMQCIFGQSDPYQMLVGGRPGRYVLIEDAWVFEEGDFNQNECYSLRLEFFLSLLSQ